MANKEFSHEQANRLVPRQPSTLPQHSFYLFYFLSLSSPPPPSTLSHELIGKTSCRHFWSAESLLPDTLAGDNGTSLIKDGDKYISKTITARATYLGRFDLSLSFYSIAPKSFYGD